MKSIDLFAGCGGLSLGLKYSGFDVKLASDFKSYACDTYLRNFKNAQYIVDDILNIEKIIGIDLYNINIKLILLLEDPHAKVLVMLIDRDFQMIQEISYTNLFLGL